MMVVDTSAWIEWIIFTPVAARFVGDFPSRKNCIVPTIVQLELSKWLKREEKDPNDFVKTIGYTNQCHVVSLDTRLALGAAAMHRQYRLATADAVIYATAVHLGAQLLTCDAHFKELPQVLYYAKT